jgi:hypothetical protein
VALIPSLFAGLGLLACLLLMLRLVLSPAQRRRFDAAGRELLQALRHAPQRWRRRRALREQASRVADEAIRRAREGRWDGNVYRPKSFRKPPKH